MTQQTKTLRVAVDLFGRKFVVAFDDNGEPRWIKTRKLYAEGRPWVHLSDVSYWHHSRGAGKPNSRPSMILAAARAKRDARAKRGAL